MLSQVWAALQNSVDPDENNIPTIEVVNNPPAIYELDHKSHGYIKGIIKYNNSTYIKVDFVKYLTGKEASEIAIKEKAYFIDDGDTIVDITDGYYISNPHPNIANIPLENYNNVSFLMDGDGKQSINPPKELNEALLLDYIENQTLLILVFNDGGLREVGEQFIP